MSKATATMLAVLQLADAGRPLYEGCNGRSEHGGRERTVAALKRRRWLDLAGEPTPSGRAILCECQQRRDEDAAVDAELKAKYANEPRLPRVSLGQALGQYFGKAG